MITKKKGIFLDRDGVINHDTGHVGKINDFIFIENAINAIKILQDKGYTLIVVTNQAGIGKGFYSEDDFHELSNYMNSILQENSIDPLNIYYCPNHPEAIIDEYRTDSLNRKPNPGMILKASKKHNIDLSNSYIVGDKYSDLLAGYNAKVKSKILLRSNNILSLDEKKYADKVFNDLFSFASWIENS